MTLTHLLPSLRRTLPTPLDRDRWPEFTTTTTDDVSVAGVSLARLADWCGTPCVHTATALMPGTGGMPSATELTSVVVARVLAVTVASDGSADAWIDARMAGSAFVMSEARMLGRVSTARDRAVRVRSPYDEDAPVDAVYLGGDLRAGDLLAIPCRGTARLRDIDPDRHRLVRDGGEPDSFFLPPHCGR
jgi:hypothetical protein